MKLTAENVGIVFRQCLFSEGEPTENAVMVDGIMTNVGFNPERLEQNIDNISSMLGELSDDFFPDGGAGMSFLHMPFDKHQGQWGEQRNAEQLMLLGLAIEKVKYLMPRDAWKMLPGAMPYIQVSRA